MTKEEMKSYLHEYADQYLSKSRNGLYDCPICGSGTGTNMTGALNINGDNWYCHSCGNGGDIFRLVMMSEGLDFSGALLKVKTWIKGIGGYCKNIDTRKQYKMKKEESKDYSKAIKYAKINATSTDYLRNRGISDDTVQKYNVGFWANYKHTGKCKVMFWTKPDGYTLRAIDDNDKCRYIKCGKSHLFNPEPLRDSDRPIFIVEGEIDALSVLEVGGIAVGLGSTSNKGILIDGLKKIKPKTPLLLALDNDAPGQQTQVELDAALTDLNIEHYIVNPSGTHKDPNEALVNDREAFTQEIKEKYEKYVN